MPAINYKEKKEYDAVIVGSGPNGLAAAITLQRSGLSVLMIEGRDTLGGGMRSEELTLPGFIHDVCSAIHPLAVESPFFNSLPLEEYGLKFIYPTISAAHPFDDGTAAILKGSVDETASQFGEDANAYKKLLTNVVNDWPLLKHQLLGPLFPGPRSSNPGPRSSNPGPRSQSPGPDLPRSLLRFGIKALPSASYTAGKFKTMQARALIAGMAAHSMQPLTNYGTSAIALVLLLTGHRKGWPIAAGGSGSIAKALANYFMSIGGKIQTGLFITSLQQLPSSHAVLFDVSPKQLMQIAGHSFSSIYQWQLKRYRYGMGVFKIDWALDDIIPFTSDGARKAGTVHLGNSFEEIAYSEKLSASGSHCDKPFVLIAQQTVFDPSRAPEGKQVAWGYCHVPHGSLKDMTAEIEQQVERFAPGFRERILARHTMNTKQMEEYNPNYIGGDINGGIQDIMQLFTRPALRYSPYRTSAKGLYICSSSTPPGGGVHGMCGYHAATRVLKDLFI